MQLKDHFGYNLVDLLSDKITAVDATFSRNNFKKALSAQFLDYALTGRVACITDALYTVFGNYEYGIGVLLQILGDENLKETGMFTDYYWVMPIAKYVEVYGLDNFQLSMQALEAITKRNTAEYAVRPFITRYTDEMLPQMTHWAQSDNFHLRRLSSEGLRPKLPWAKKLDLFTENPTPVFAILELLKDDPIKFVMKSVGNHLADYLKLNPSPALLLLDRWAADPNATPHRHWIIKHAKRKYKE